MILTVKKVYLKLKKHLEANTGLSLVYAPWKKCLLALVKIGLDTIYHANTFLLSSPTIFTHRPTWQWNNLPQTYLQSAYLSTDTQALHDYFQPFTDNLADPLITNTEEHPSPESNSTATSFPKPVSIHQIVLKQCMYMLKYTQECVNTYNVMLK